MTQYAVKIPFDNEGDMLYVTEGDSKFHLRPLLFSTEAEAKQHANRWGSGAIVVEYTEESDLL